LCWSGWWGVTDENRPRICRIQWSWNGPNQHRKFFKPKLAMDAKNRDHQSSIA
jgi:hypothetical protein